MYTAKVTSKGQITLPKEVRVALKIEEGERVLILPDPVTGGFIFSNVQAVSVDHSNQDRPQMSVKLGKGGR